MNKKLPTMKLVENVVVTVILSPEDLATAEKMFGAPSEVSLHSGGIQGVLGCLLRASFTFEVTTPINDECPKYLLNLKHLSALVHHIEQ